MLDLEGTQSVVGVHDRVRVALLARNRCLRVLTATGMRRSELLGLRWDDVDLKRARVSVNRGLVAVAYQLRESRGKTPNSRRAIDLDETTIKVLTAWRDWQRAEQDAAGIESRAGCSPTPTAGPYTLIRSPRPSGALPSGQECHGFASNDIRHTHGTLLIKTGIPVKVVSERLGHANPAFTIEPYQHVLPGLAETAPPSSSSSTRRELERPVEAPVEEQRNTVEALAGSALARASRSG